MPYELFGADHLPPSPLIFDSPHSWGRWPTGVPVQAPHEVVQSSWDAFIDELWSEASQGRAPVLAARFHRAYLDANRARSEIDPAMLDGPWPEPLQPSKKTLVGQGLIRRDAIPGVPMYAGKLSVHDVQQRLLTYYDPYHDALSRLIDAAHQRHGFSVHIDCHSMKSVGNAMNEDNGQPRPDVVVSDRDGTTASPELTRYIQERLSRLGYQVQVNYPYKGAELIRRHSNPAGHRHSVQIEIKRGLYMDERHFTKNTGYPELASQLQRFVHQLLLDLDGDLGQQLRGAPR